jgi:hypothetical protein
MKSAASNEKTQESRASANQPLMGGTAQLFAPGAVAQLQLQPGALYQAKTNVAVYSTSKKSKTDTALTANEQYTVKRVFGTANKAELYHAPSKKYYFLPDGNDAEFTRLTPALDDSNRMKPESLEYMDFYDDTYTPSTPMMNTVSEGEIGDCWFIGPMLALALSNRKDDLKSGVTVDAVQHEYNVQLHTYDDSVAPGNAMPGKSTVAVNGLLPVVSASVSLTKEQELLYAQLGLHIPPTHRMRS